MKSQRRGDRAENTDTHRKGARSIERGQNHLNAKDCLAIAIAIGAPCPAFLHQLAVLPASLHKVC